MPSAVSTSEGGEGFEEVVFTAHHLLPPAATFEGNPINQVEEIVHDHFNQVIGEPCTLSRSAALRETL